ncbi:MAG: hypothetical protein HPY44_14020 [Armatimonadetes bacterium]|nr:hypothetical protein [Armatimonadota bacterium]
MKRKPTSPTLTPAAAGVLLAVVALTGAGPLSACDTPVFEYALYHWTADSYTVVYLSDRPEVGPDRKANGYLEKMGSLEDGFANVRLVRLNPKQLPETTPPDLREAVERHAQASLPLHLVYTPRGDEIHAGRLSPEDARALVESPLRKQIADMLVEERKQGVLLLLSGEDADANASARQAALQAIETAKQFDVNPGFLEIDAGTPEEKWLVKQLRALPVEESAQSAPLLFGCFGRGHVEGPVPAAGGTVDPALMLLDFMSGPCTCVVKEAGMGLDLLIRRNWDASLPAGGPPELRPMEPGGYIAF